MRAKGKEGMGMIEGLPQGLFWYLWIVIGLNFISVYEIFVTKPQLRSVRSRQTRALMSLLIGFILLTFMMGWVR